MNRAEVLADGITYYDEFLSADECRIILEELQIAFWQPSKVIQTNDQQKLQEVLSRSRISHTAYQQWFPAKLNIVLKRIEKQLCRLVHSKSDRLEPWQATRYPFRGKFDYHLDAGYWTYHSAGERMRTFLLYLDTPLKGGETHFRALDISVTAKAGRLLTWDNLFDNGCCNYRMMHSGKPLLKGKKTTLVSWERQKTFRIAAPLIGQHKQ